MMEARKLLEAKCSLPAEELFSRISTIALVSQFFIVAVTAVAQCSVISVSEKHVLSSEYKEPLSSTSR